MRVLAAKSSSGSLLINLSEVRFVELNGKTARLWVGGCDLPFNLNHDTLDEAMVFFNKLQEALPLA